MNNVNCPVCEDSKLILDGLFNPNMIECPFCINDVSNQKIKDALEDYDNQQVRVHYTPFDL